MIPSLSRTSSAASSTDTWTTARRDKSMAKMRDMLSPDAMMIEAAGKMQGILSADYDVPAYVSANASPAKPVSVKFKFRRADGVLKKEKSYDIFYSGSILDDDEDYAAVNMMDAKPKENKEQSKDQPTSEEDEQPRDLAASSNSSQTGAVSTPAKQDRRAFNLQDLNFTSALAIMQDLDNLQESKRKERRQTVDSNSTLSSTVSGRVEELFASDSAVIIQNFPAVIFEESEGTGSATSTSSLSAGSGGKTIEVFEMIHSVSEESQQPVDGPRRYAAAIGRLHGATRAEATAEKGKERGDADEETSSRFDRGCESPGPEEEEGGAIAHVIDGARPETAAEGEEGIEGARSETSVEGEEGRGREIIEYYPADGGAATGDDEGAEGCDGTSSSWFDCAFRLPGAEGSAFGCWWGRIEEKEDAGGFGRNKGQPADLPKMWEMRDFSKKSALF